jgi:long-chain acyl-CoA synthetase
MKSPRALSSHPRGYPGGKKKPTGRARHDNVLIRLLDRAKEDPGRTALLRSDKDPAGPISYGELLDRIEKLASGLLRLGVRKGDRVALLSENRPEWTIADFSVMAVGGVTVPIYTNLSPQQLAYQLKHSRTKLALVSQGAHLQSLRALRDKLPGLQRMVFLEGSLPGDHAATDLPIGEIESLGDEDRRPLEVLASKIAPSDPATIVYTSGTNSQWPKGVVLTHRNFLAEKEAVRGVLKMQKGDVVLSFLPLSHILQRTVDMFTLLEGATLAHCTDMDSVPEGLLHFRPHLLVGVPRTWEKIRESILENLLNSAPPLRDLYQQIFRWMEDEHLHRGQAGRLPSGLGAPLRWIRKRAVQKIRSRMGGRLRHCFSAGAPLPRDLEAFFDVIEMPLFNVYGMTELTGAVTANGPDRRKPGTVGLPLPGCELGFAEDGEILVRGDVVAGGYHRPGKPPERIADAQGWLATGDVGHLDEDGFLVITGRKKELLITAAGKNIPPQPIEGRLRRSPYVKQAMVVGDGRRYLTALIVPAFHPLEALASRKRIVFKNRLELLEHPKVRALYQDLVESVNKDLCRFETLKRFVLLPEPFTQEAGELTPTNRLRRPIIERHYRREIDAMYLGPA